MPPVAHLLAPAKLTRQLRVVGVRGDGYHLLEAEMATLDLADELEIDEGGEGLEIDDGVAWRGRSRRWRQGPEQARPAPQAADNLVSGPSSWPGGAQR